MKRFFVIIVFLLVGYVQLLAQEEDTTDVIQYVLMQEIVDSTFVLGETNDNGGVERNLTYLGKIQIDESICKVVLYTIFRYWYGSDSKILLFDERDRIIAGFYTDVLADVDAFIVENQIQLVNEEHDYESFLDISVSIDSICLVGDNYYSCQKK